MLIFCYRNKAGKNKIASEVLIVSSHYCNSMQKKGNDGFTNSFAGDSSTQCCGSRMIFFGSDPGSGSDFSESSGSDPGSGSGSYSGSGSCMNTYTHTQISTHIHTYIHTDTKTYTNTNTHTYTHAHTHYYLYVTII